MLLGGEWKVLRVRGGSGEASLGESDLYAVLAELAARGQNMQVRRYLLINPHYTH
jgi:hypothetical protein